MSGHSKWHRIKRKKELTDAKRGAEFTKHATHIKQLAQQNPNPAANAQLTEAIKRAKQANMPQENIDRLLSKAAEPTQEVIYEAFGPGGSALIISVSTDNAKRTIAELRATLKKHGGSISGPGSVLWKFTAGSDGTYTPQYPMQLGQTTRDQVKTLITELEQLPDVQHVVTDLTS